MNRGVFLAISAYVWWGLSPLYWNMVDSPPNTILGHRILWATVTLALVHTVRRSWPALLAAVHDRRVLAFELMSGFMIGANWWVFLWALSVDQAVEASLGYFMTPIVSVCLGLGFLKEQLRPPQWAAVGLSALGVTWLTIQVGSVPWVAVVLAGTFGLYGLFRKVSGVSSVDGLSIEVAALVVPAVTALFFLERSGTDVIPDAPMQMALLILAGVVTVTPLLLFASAARMTTLSMVGLLQFINPTIQFLVAVVIFREPLESSRLIGFAMIWVALVLLMLDSAKEPHNPTGSTNSPSADTSSADTPSAEIGSEQPMAKLSRNSGAQRD